MNEYFEYEKCSNCVIIVFHVEITTYIFVYYKNIKCFIDISKIKYNYSNYLKKKEHLTNLH